MYGIPGQMMQGNQMMGMQMQGMTVQQQQQFMMQQYQRMAQQQGMGGVCLVFCFYPYCSNGNVEKIYT